MKKTIVLFLLLLVLQWTNAQDAAPVDSFRFSILKQNRITPVKNQAASGTCWSFSALGFFEAELLRMGKPEVDLSEMFVVHHSYTDKADKYVRSNGTINFSSGGSFADVVYVLKNYGIVPESAMTGLHYGEEKHNHGELDALTQAYVKVIISNPNKRLSTAWKNGFDGILNAYLGSCPKEFSLGGNKFTPMTYVQSLGLNMNDYVLLTSFTHHPFYSKFAIEIPDNWRWAESYNLPLEDFARVLENAVNNGFPVACSMDVSEKGFRKKGIAVNPQRKDDNSTADNQRQWNGFLQKEIEDEIYSIEKPELEVKVTQEIRQASFDNLQTTDDHGMVIYGIAKDQNGTKYYLMKNSWGTDSEYKGIWYVSESFAQQKTINILLHKDAIPPDIQKKLGLKYFIFNGSSSGKR